MVCIHPNNLSKFLGGLAFCYAGDWNCIGCQNKWTLKRHLICAIKEVIKHWCALFRKVYIKEALGNIAICKICAFNRVVSTKCADVATAWKGCKQRLNIKCLCRLNFVVFCVLRCVVKPNNSTNIIHCTDLRAHCCASDMCKVCTRNSANILATRAIIGNGADCACDGLILDLWSSVIRGTILSRNATCLRKANAWNIDILCVVIVIENLLQCFRACDCAKVFTHQTAKRVFNWFARINRFKRAHCGDCGEVMRGVFKVEHKCIFVCVGADAILDKPAVCANHSTNKNFVWCGIIFKCDIWILKPHTYVCKRAQIFARNKPDVICFVFAKVFNVGINASFNHQIIKFCTRQNLWEKPKIVDATCCIFIGDFKMNIDKFCVCVAAADWTRKWFDIFKSVSCKVNAWDNQIMLCNGVCLRDCRHKFLGGADKLWKGLISAIRIYNINFLHAVCWEGVAFGKHCAWNEVKRSASVCNCAVVLNINLTAIAVHADINQICILRCAWHKHNIKFLDIGKRVHICKESEIIICAWKIKCFLIICYANIFKRCKCLNIDWKCRAVRNIVVNKCDCEHKFARQCRFIIAVEHKCVVCDCKIAKLVDKEVFAAAYQCAIRCHNTDCACILVEHIFNHFTIGKFNAQITLRLCKVVIFIPNITKAIHRKAGYLCFHRFAGIVLLNLHKLQAFNWAININFHIESYVILWILRVNNFKVFCNLFHRKGNCQGCKIIIRCHIKNAHSDDIILHFCNISNLGFIHIGLQSKKWCIAFGLCDWKLQGVFTRKCHLHFGNIAICIGTCLGDFIAWVHRKCCAWKGFHNLKLHIRKETILRCYAHLNKACFVWHKFKFFCFHAIFNNLGYSQNAFIACFVFNLKVAKFNSVKVDDIKTIKHLCTRINIKIKCSWKC